MEVEVPPPPSPPVSDSPMECASPSGRVGRRSSRRRVGDTAPTSDMDCDEPAAATDSASQPHSLDTGPGTGQPHTSSLQPLELSGVPSTRIEECLAWLASQTHFAPAQTTAALRSLYDQQPLMLQSGGDTFAACEARHDSLCEILRTVHGADSLPRDGYGQSPLTAVDMAAADEGAAAPSRQRNRPAIPPGFEPRVTASIAAQHAAQVALTGLSAVRRSARIRQPGQERVPPPDTTDAAASTAGLPPPWAHVWSVLHTSQLDRRQLVTAWRLLHGKLFVGAFLRRIHRPDAAGHRCPHPGCVDQAATITHVLVTCPLAAAVWDWFAATWAAITGEDAPPRSPDLFLADDQRTWRPASQLRPLWHRFRLSTISQLWAAYQRMRHQPDA